MDLTELSDEQLLRRYLAGDEECAAVFYQRHARVLELYLLARGCNRSDAEDVVQESLAELTTGIKLDPPKFSLNEPVEPWLFVVARNRHLDIKRRNNRRREVAIEDVYQNDQPSAIEQLVGKETYERLLVVVAKCLASQSAEKRQLFQKYLDDARSAYSEYCVQHGLESTEANRKPLRQAVNKIKKIIQKMFPRTEFE